VLCAQAERSCLIQGLTWDLSAAAMKRASTTRAIDRAIGAISMCEHGMLLQRGAVYYESGYVVNASRWRQC
jgi:hypothetical protein